ncbi:ependymin-related protein 1-like [Haliotis rubra]|uniref:ependymin-related protein 1-like n=1 Tax=Haliotis rubra TaxID=36100 RepID=UPI001EE6357A|nr:ependymin-related protein 1-like [Haliotis rubra]
MLRIIVLAVVVAAAVADPCCTPDQWQGDMGSITGAVTDGISRTAKVSGMTAYDYINKMVAQTTTVTEGSLRMTNKTIINFNTKMMYLIDSTRDLCEVKSIDQPMKQACTPPGAEEVGQFYFGAGADNELDATSYKFTANAMEGYLSVTSLDCLPITLVTYGQIGNTATMTTIGFADVMLKIEDPSIFDPPSSCDEAKATPLENHGIHSFLGTPTTHHV